MGVERRSSSIVSVLYEFLFGCLPVLESRNLKMKAVLLLFAMIVVAFGQEADEGWEETPPADPSVEENKYKTDKYGNKPYGYKPSYGQESYGYQKPTYGGYDEYKPTYGHNSYGYQNPMYGGYQKHGYGNSYGYKKPYGTKYDSSHVDNTIKKVGEYADAQEDYKKQSLNIKYSYDAVPTEYDYVEKYGWGRPTTIGSLYNGYGYGNQYPQQYGYGHQHSYGYKRPSYGYKKPSYRKKPYGYKSKYGKKPKEDQD